MQRTAIDRSCAHVLGWRHVVFSLTDARRALPYVARIASDASAAFHQIQACRTALQGRLSEQERAELSRQRDHALQRLNAAIDECNTVGADLLDIPAGTVRFNAQIHGRQLSLLWTLGEPVTNAWPSLDDTAGTQPRQAATARCKP